MHIEAIAQGQVVSVSVDPGSSVGSGSVIIVTELMKMLNEYRAPDHGTVTRVFVEVGDMVEPGQNLFEIEVMENTESSTSTEIEDGYTTALIDELIARRMAHTDGGRATRIAKRHAGGNRTARENVADLLDKGSFSELGAHALAAQQGVHSREQLIERSAADGVIIGTGSIDGVAVAVLVVDYTVMAGTQGHFHHKKVDRIIDLAERSNLPLILYPEGGGGRPNDVDANKISIAQLDISSFHHLAALRGKVPVVAVVHGYCFAGSAAFAAVADVIIGTKKACLGMGGPAMIEGGGLGSFRPEEVGPSSILSDMGVYDIVVEDEAAATSMAKSVVHYLNKTAGKPNFVATDLFELLPMDRRSVFNVKSVINAIFDEGSLLEIKPDYATNMITGFARLNGCPVAVLANNCAKLGGAIDGVAADKAAHMLELCTTHKLPVISFIDTPGFMVGPEAEETGQVRPIGRFFTQGARFDQPLIAVVMRRAYGLGAMAMAGGSLHSSDLTLSWPNGEFGAMGLEGAVRLGMRNHLAAIENDEEREAEFVRLTDQLYERGKALNAAAFFELDDVITPDETRERLIKSLSVMQAR